MCRRQPHCGFFFGDEATLSLTVTRTSQVSHYLALSTRLPVEQMSRREVSRPTADKPISHMRCNAGRQPHQIYLLSPPAGASPPHPSSLSVCRPLSTQEAADCEMKIFSSACAQNTMRLCNHRGCGECTWAERCQKKWSRLMSHSEEEGVARRPQM